MDCFFLIILTRSSQKQTKNLSPLVLDSYKYIFVFAKESILDNVYFHESWIIPI